MARCRAQKQVGNTVYRCGKKAYHSGWCGNWKPVIHDTQCANCGKRGVISPIGSLLSYCPSCAKKLFNI